MNKMNIFEILPECIRKNFEELYLRSSLGIMPLSTRDIAARRRSVDVRSCHHVNIKIPYADKFLKWEIVFNPDDYTFPPNFYFHDDEFLSDPDVETLAKEVPSLEKWNLKDPTSLSQILNEFIILYKKEQINKLRRENMYSRFYEEYQLLLTENSVDMVEVSVDGSSVTFLVALKINCSDLPNYIQDGPMQWCNPGEDFAHLKISISNAVNSRYGILLQLSPHLEQVLGNMRNITLPDLKPDSTIMEYVSAVNRLINSRIEAVAKHFKMKKAYIYSFVAKCPEMLVEYDTESLDSITILFKLEDYQCLVTVKIGPRFPTEKPQVKLASIYCQEGKQCNEILDRYPYNATSSPELNISNLLEYLEDAVGRFMKHQH